MMLKVFIGAFAAAVIAQSAAAMPLTGDAAKAHNAAKVQCQTCHVEGVDKPAPASSCLTCHGSYKAAAALTASLKPNPHDSHMGEIRCTICHAAHRPSQVYCNQCHTFESLKFGK